MVEPSAAGVEVLREGRVTRMVLDRPRALNALNLAMVRQIRDLLEGWRSEDLRAVTIESSTPGMFCAGGDIRQVRQNTLDGDLAASEEFFATEYRVNEMLASYPVPVIALIDGVCMGGGLGLSAHGPFRVVSENAVLAMPETSIGFFPDIGATHFLPRLPGAVGSYLGLTGARLGPADALDVGLATHHVTSDEFARVPELVNADARPVDAILRDLASSPESQAVIPANRPLIERAFSGTSIEIVMRRLAEDSSEWATGTRATLEGVSPQSLGLTLDMILWGRERSLRECLDAERESARQIVTTPDFIEGVRAALVDKDRMPAWSASRYAGMSSEGVTRWRAAESRLSGDGHLQSEPVASQ